MNRQHVSAKVGFCAKPGSLPVLKEAISGCWRLRRPGCENSHQDVGTFREINCAGDNAGDNSGGSNFRLYGALEDAHYDVSGLQAASSDSLSSSRRTEAARNSLKSSSDQESDQSILRSDARSARRSINRDDSPAASGGSRRNAVSRDASCEFTRISMILDLVYGAPEAIRNDPWRSVESWNHRRLDVPRPIRQGFGFATCSRSASSRWRAVASRSRMSSYTNW